MVSITRAFKLNETQMIYSIDNASLSYKKNEKLYLIHLFGTESRATILPCLHDSTKALWDLFARKNSILYRKSLKVLKVFEHSKYEFIYHSDHYKNRFPAPGLRESSLRVHRAGEHTMTPRKNLLAGYRLVMVLHYQIISYVLRSGSHFKCYSMFLVVWIKIIK